MTMSAGVTQKWGKIAEITCVVLAVITILMVFATTFVGVPSVILGLLVLAVAASAIAIGLLRSHWANLEVEYLQSPQLRIRRNLEETLVRRSTSVPAKDLAKALAVVEQLFELGSGPYQQRTVDRLSGWWNGGLHHLVALQLFKQSLESGTGWVFNWSPVAEEFPMPPDFRLPRPSSRKRTRLFRKDVERDILDGSL